jgi:hypothetical protein
MEEAYQGEPENAMKILKKWKTFLWIALFLTLFFKFSSLLVGGIDADFENVRIGKIECVFPARFIQGKQSRVQANIHYKGGDFGIHNSEEEKATHVDSVRVGEAMKIEIVEIDNLESSSFSINPIGNSEQVIDTSDYMSGNWE